MGRTRAVSIPAAFAGLLALSTSLPGGDRFLALQAPAGTQGCQEHGGPIGMDFDVEVNIQVTRLGVFDDNADGLTRTITARLYDRDTQTPLATMVFTPEDPGELVGGYRLKDVDTEVELGPGFHGTISADGYGPGERNGNGWCIANVVDGGRCALAFVGGARWGMDPGVFPASIDGGPAYRYLSGTFEFEQLQEAVPREAVAFVAPAFAPGNSSVRCVRGLDFDVEADIEVTRLGVFDSLGDGLLSTLTARLYDRDSREELASLEFTEVDAGELVGGSVFKDLGAPLGIPAGTRCTITAEGYGDLELAGDDLPGTSTDHGGCLIRFGGRRVSYEATGFPPYLSQYSSFAAGTLVFRPPAAAVPKPQPPTAVAATVALGQVQVSWTPPAAGPAPAGYNIYRARPGDLTKLNGDPVAGTSFTVASSVKGIETCYLVRSVLANGIQGPASAEACAETPSPTAPAQTSIAFQAPDGAAGNQVDYPGLIGAEFNAVGEIVVTRLGVFDDFADGLRNTLTAHLIDRASRGVLASVAFPPEDPGDLEAGFRLKDLPVPIGLPAGFRGIIAAEGYGPLDLNGNSQFGPVVQTFDDGGCAITSGCGRWGPSGAFPLYGTSNTHVAATFEFAPLGAIPAGPTEGIAYQVPAGTVGNQSHPGALGLDFDVLKPIRVTRLGVFDDRSDGLLVPITAYLYDRATRGILASIVFPPEDPGELIGGSRFKDLDEPLVLAAGFQGTIDAEGYGNLERNGNQSHYGVMQEAFWTTFDGDCSIRFVGGGRFQNVVGVFPDILDGGPANRYAGGTFWFEPEEPEGTRFHRGDPNDDGSMNITDGIFVLNFLFLGGAGPACAEAANPNDDDSINITDGIYILNYLFLGGPPPALPGPPESSCGPDPEGSVTDLGCDAYASC